jgi:hypothetical protein
MPQPGSSWFTGLNPFLAEGFYLRFDDSSDAHEMFLQTMPSAFQAYGTSHVTNPEDSIKALKSHFAKVACFSSTFVLNSDLLSNTDEVSPLFPLKKVFLPTDEQLEHLQADLSVDHQGYIFRRLVDPAATGLTVPPLATLLYELASTFPDIPVLVQEDQPISTPGLIHCRWKWAKSASAANITSYEELRQSFPGNPTFLVFANKTWATITLNDAQFSTLLNSLEVNFNSLQENILSAYCHLPQPFAYEEDNIVNFHFSPISGDGNCAIAAVAQLPNPDPVFLRTSLVAAFKSIKAEVQAQFTETFTMEDGSNEQVTALHPDFESYFSDQVSFLATNGCYNFDGMDYFALMLHKYWSLNITVFRDGALLQQYIHPTTKKIKGHRYILQSGTRNTQHYDILIPTFGISSTVPAYVPASAPVASLPVLKQLQSDSFFVHQAVFATDVLWIAGLPSRCVKDPSEVIQQILEPHGFTLDMSQNTFPVYNRGSETFSTSVKLATSKLFGCFVGEASTEEGTRRIHEQLILQKFRYQGSSQSLTIILEAIDTTQSDCVIDLMRWRPSVFIRGLAILDSTAALIQNLAIKRHLTKLGIQRFQLRSSMTTMVRNNLVDNNRNLPTIASRTHSERFLVVYLPERADTKLFQQLNLTTNDPRIQRSFSVEGMHFSASTNLPSPTIEAPSSVFSESLSAVFRLLPHQIDQIPKFVDVIVADGGAQINQIFCIIPDEKSIHIKNKAFTNTDGMIQLIIMLKQRVNFLPDTLSTLNTSPPRLHTLFPGNLHEVFSLHHKPTTKPNSTTNSRISTPSREDRVQPKVLLSKHTTSAVAPQSKPSRTNAWAQPTVQPQVQSSFAAPSLNLASSPASITPEVVSHVSNKSLTQPISSDLHTDFEIQFSILERSSQKLREDFNSLHKSLQAQEKAIQANQTRITSNTEAIKGVMDMHAQHMLFTRNNETSIRMINSTLEAIQLQLSSITADNENLFLRQQANDTRQSVIEAIVQSLETRTVIRSRSTSRGPKKNSTKGRKPTSRSRSRDKSIDNTGSDEEAIFPTSTDVMSDEDQSPGDNHFVQSKDGTN